MDYFMNKWFDPNFHKNVENIICQIHLEARSLNCYKAYETDVLNQNSFFHYDSSSVPDI